VARRTGRRPGSPDTRATILAAARAAFADKGYNGASIRGIAARAGVDPALVHHYFGTKNKLFLAAMEVPVDLDRMIETMVAGPVDELGRRIVTTLVRLWESPAGAGVLGLLRSGVGDETVARLMREFVLTQILRRIFDHLDVDRSEAPFRAGLVLSQMLGVALARYILKVDPIASIPPEQLITAVAPTVQRYLTGDLSGMVSPDAGYAGGPPSAPGGSGDPTTVPVGPGTSSPGAGAPVAGASVAGGARSSG